MAELTWEHAQTNGARISYYKVAVYENDNMSWDQPMQQPSMFDEHKNSQTQSLTIEGLVEGNNYSFEVRAYNRAGWGDYSERSEELCPDKKSDIIRALVSTMEGRLAENAGADDPVQASLRILGQIASETLTAEEDESATHTVRGENPEDDRSIHYTEAGEAAWELRNMACGVYQTARMRRMIVQGGAIPAAAMLIELGVKHTQFVGDRTITMAASAAACLGCLAVDDSAHVELIVTTEGLCENVIKLLSGDGGTSWGKQQAAGFIRAISVNEEVCEFLAKLVVIQPLLDLSVSGEHSAKADALAALENFKTHSLRLRAVINDAYGKLEMKVARRQFVSY
jgi:hypothetical protein